MKFELGKRDLVKIVVVCEIVGLILFVCDFLTARGDVNQLDRPLPGQGTAEEELTVQVNDEESDIVAEISESYGTLSERKEMLAKAKEEIDSEFCGKNKSVDHIDQSVVISDTYVNRQVSAEWEFSNYSVINSEGILQYDNIEEPITVQATATLEYQGLQDIYVFDFMIYPADMNNEEGKAYYLSKSLTEADEADRENDTVDLPDQIEGFAVHFKRKTEWRGLILMMLGIVILIMWPMLQREKEKEKENQRQQKLMLDYPRIVSQMSLYINAGVSVSNTINRMVSEYERRRKRSGKVQPGYEELKLWCNEVGAGQSEAQAFTNLGKRCDNAEYKKLAMLLVQNMRKGTKGLAAKLELEEQRAFEKRKAMAKTKGEEASTKLLLPMMGMLGIVLVILIFPAFMQMNL